MARLILLRVAAVALALLAAGCMGSRQDRQLPQDRGVAVMYVAMGDSTVEGFGASSPEAHYVSRLYERLRTVYPEAKLANLGVGGATSADVIGGQLQRAVALRPHLITLSIGPNDITGRVPVEQYEQNIDTIFRRLTREIAAVLVVNLLPDLAVTPRFNAGEQKDVVARQTLLFNEALGRKGRQYGVELVDLYAPSREEVPKRPQLIALDGYHPSDLGYARWAELMWKGVEARIAAR